jgi:hypothetical protein
MTVFGWKTFHEIRVHKYLSPSSFLRYFNLVNNTLHFLQTCFNFVPQTTLFSAKLSLLFRNLFICCYTAHERSYAFSLLYVTHRETPLESSNLCQILSEANVSALPRAFDDLCTLLNHPIRFTLLVIEIHLAEYVFWYSQWFKWRWFISLNRHFLES